MLTNHLLAALPEADYQRLVPFLEKTSLTAGQVLFEAREPIQAVYFPIGAAVTLLALVEGKETAAIAPIGCEGFVGLPLFLGGDATVYRAVVQIPGSAWKMDADTFKRECDRSEEFSRVLLLYTQACLTQVAQTACCYAHHEIEKRFARWLLSLSDCTNELELPLTQRKIADALGVRRASITEAAIALQEAKIIRYTRGRITIADRPALELKACECYRIVKSEYERLSLLVAEKRDRLGAIGNSH